MRNHIFPLSLWALAALAIVSCAKGNDGDAAVPESGRVVNSSASKSETEPTVKKRVVCWGTSVVNGQLSFVPYLQELLGDEWEVYNGGCSGDRSYEVAARQGANPIVTASEFTIPANVTNVSTEGLLRTRSISGEPGLYPLRAFRGYLRNPCKLVGTNGEEVLCDILSYFRTTDNGNGGKDTTYYATVKRLEPGDPVVIAEHTPVETYAARELRDVDLSVLYMGGNDGHRDFNNIVYQHQQMIDYADNSEDYIVVGYYMYPSWERYGYTDIMTTAFGNRFLDQRNDVTESDETVKQWLLWSGAYPDEESIPESEYTRASNGYWPLAFLLSASDPHSNIYGCKVTAKLIYDKMVDLGYVDVPGPRAPGLPSWGDGGDLETYPISEAGGAQLPSWEDGGEI